MSSSPQETDTLAPAGPAISTEDQPAPTVKKTFPDRSQQVLRTKVMNMGIHTIIRLVSFPILVAWTLSLTRYHPEPINRLSFHYITKILAVSALAALQWKGWMEPYKLSEDDKKDERVFSGKHLNAAIHTCLYAATLGAAMFTLFDPYAHARSPWSFLELLHVTLSLAASGLRVWSIYALGRHFTFEVGITKDHELIGTGPYKYLRHPSYTGALLGPYGFVWFLGWRSMLFWVPTLSVAAALLVARIQNEEETMAEHFKDTWKAYAAKRWRLIPFVY